MHGICVDSCYLTACQLSGLVFWGVARKYLQILFTEYLPDIELIVATSVAAGLELIQRSLPDCILLNAGGRWH